jgi:hypothetical protein
LFFTIINAPFRGLIFSVGKPGRTLNPGFHFVMPWERVRQVSTALHTEEVDVDVITQGGTPTQVKVGFSGRVVDIEGALVNTQNPFATLRVSVISVVSGAANSYSIDQLAQYKNDISKSAEEELMALSKKNGWGLGDFQIAVGDPSLSEDLKKLMMREEAVKRENQANLDKAKNQLEVAKQLAAVGAILKNEPIAHELLRLQMLSDMGAGGKVVVIDAKAGTAGLAGLAN